MKTKFKLLLLVGAFVILGGCAHSIRIAPEAGKLPSAEGVKRSAKNVGYYISEDERHRRVITPGGGGDKVEYAPYQELESGLFQVLNNVFENVYPLKSVDDKAFIAEKGITIVMRPSIGTNSLSTSLFTWPPTEFDVIIEIKAMDASGKVLWADTVTGKGNAEFSEFRSDFGLAAKRASAAALAQLQARLLASSIVR